MAISNTTRNALEQIGMTSYEIKTFLTLLEMEKSTASDISKRSGVPYSKIYEILGMLEKKSWIESDDSRPTIYMINSPETGVNTIQQETEELFKKNKEMILKELMPIYKKKGISERPNILVISGGINILVKMSEIVESCNKEILIALPSMVDSELIKQALPKLRLLSDKGIEITTLITNDYDKDLLKAVSRLSNLKIKKDLFAGGIISDQRYVMILLGSHSKNIEESVAIWAEHPGLANFAREYFEYLLNDSKKV
ncbi:MAG: helix-turn-helix domain-containing protein [Candidatus Nitrosoabyssus spongiisocia]|nr:MAG: helix-turn-helix domain-containing protein [Nitrosopumilaceae archaeon AB1(1)]